MRGDEGPTWGASVAVEGGVVVEQHSIKVEHKVSWTFMQLALDTFIQPRHGQCPAEKKVLGLTF